MPPLDSGRLRRLAMLFAMPTEDSLPVLREMAETSSWLAHAVAELELTALERWQGEYTRLFINGYPGTACAPFESSYRQGRMGGTVVGDLQALYRRAGLQATGLPADYLGTLLECAAFLAEAGDRDDLLQELRREHLERWLPRFVRDLEEHAALGFYRYLAQELRLVFETGDDD